MPTEHHEDPGQQVFREIEKDFAALVRLIDRAIEQLADGSGEDESVQRLTRAREAAELGAAWAKRGLASSPSNGKSTNLAAQ